MNKEYIKQIRAAKASHVAWRAKAQALVCGFNINESEVPVIHTSTPLGMWYYGKGQDLSKYPNFDNVEPNMILIHQMYMQVYKLAFGEVRRTLFKSKSTIKQENFLKAKEIMMQITNISEDLVQSLNALERDVAMDIAETMPKPNLVEAKVKSKSEEPQQIKLSSIA